MSLHFCPRIPLISIKASSSVGVLHHLIHVCPNPSRDIFMSSMAALAGISESSLIGPNRPIEIIQEIQLNDFHELRI